MSLSGNLWAITPIITVQAATKERSGALMSRLTFCTLITLKQEEGADVLVAEEEEKPAV